MSEFKDMLKEAFRDDAPFDPSPGRAVLDASVQKFERRMRTVRWMAFFAVTFMSVVMVAGLWLLLDASDDASARTVVLYGALFVWGYVGIGFAKGWFAIMHNHIGTMKELKRVQMMLLERERVS